MEDRLPEQGAEPPHDAEVDLAFIKQAAAATASQYGESKRALIDEHTHLFRWLTASLLALNGGAALATLSADDLTNGVKLVAGALFVLGIVLALFVGVAGQQSCQNMLPQLQGIINYWPAVSIDGERVEEREKELDKGIVDGMKFGWSTRVVGWLSGIAFVSGTIAIGMELRTTNSIEIAQAEAAPNQPEEPDQDQ